MKEDCISIHIVLLGTQLHLSTIKKLDTYHSDLFRIKSTSSIATLPDTDLPYWSYSKDTISSLVKSNSEADIIIAIIENRIEGNYFTRRLSDKSLVLTFYEAETILRDANIDLFNYLLITIYKTITMYRFSNNVLSENSSKFVHDETRSCIFDMLGNKYDLVYSTSNACLCQQCEAHSEKIDLPSDYITTLKKELKKIRKTRYIRLTDFIKQKPIISLIITAIFSVILNVLSCYIFELLFK
ncbi:TPA: hypothetical protein KPJ62_003886 [Clostridioides difficile]|nr:hypothetical protein [Clostridioides difficile]